MILIRVCMLKHVIWLVCKCESVVSPESVWFLSQALVLFASVVVAQNFLQEKGEEHEQNLVSIFTSFASY